MNEEKIGKWIAYGIIAFACIVGLIYAAKFIIHLVTS